MEEIMGATEKKLFRIVLNVMLVAVFAASIGSMYNVMRAPTIRLAADGQDGVFRGIHGELRGTAVELADPSILDRLVVGSSSIFITAMAMGVLFCCYWVGRKNRSDLDRVRLPGGLVGATAPSMAVGPIPFQFLASAHFGTPVSFDWEVQNVMLILLAMWFLFRRFCESQDGWKAEYDRAQELDERMKDVV